MAIEVAVVCCNGHPQMVCRIRFAKEWKDRLEAEAGRSAMRVWTIRQVHSDGLIIDPSLTVHDMPSKRVWTAQEILEREG